MAVTSVDVSAFLTTPATPEVLNSEMLGPILISTGKRTVFIGRLPDVDMTWNTPSAVSGPTREEFHDLHQYR